MAKITVDVDDDRAEDLKNFIEGHIGVHDVQLELEEEVEETKSAMMKREEETEGEEEAPGEEKTSEEGAEGESTPEQGTPSEEKTGSSEEEKEEKDEG